MVVSWFIAYPHSEVDNVIKDIESYIETPYKYIVALETSKTSHKSTNGEHYHVLAEMTEQRYEAYRKNIITKKYNLSGQAKSDKGRQYGKIKQIRNLKLLEYYLAKDGNLYYKGYTDEEIKEMMDNSYKKEDNKQLNIIDKCIEHLEFNQIVKQEIEYESPSYHKIYLEIIEFYLTNKIEKLPTKHTLKYITTKMLQKQFYETGNKERIKENLLHYILN